jgi:hypothetical protein
VGQGEEEPLRHRDDPLVPALAVGDEQAMLARAYVLQAQAEDLKAAQPIQQHASTIARSRPVRSATMKASTWSGSITRGRVRGARISGTPRTAR